MLANVWPQLYETAMKSRVIDPAMREDIRSDTTEVFINMVTNIFAGNPVVRISHLLKESERSYWELMYVREFGRSTIRLGSRGREGERLSSQSRVTPLSM